MAGYPPGRVLPWLDLARYPPSAPWHSGKCCKALWDVGTPQQGTPHGRFPPWLNLAGYIPICPMAFWEMLQSIMGYGYPPQVWTDKQSETITFPSYYVRGR